MNLHYYWIRGTGELFIGLVAFWTTYYRPMGGLFYLVVYKTAGFSPLAFHLAALVILSANLVLLYLVTSTLLRSRTGGGALCFGGVHAAAVQLYVDTGMIYDVLAFFFYCLTFLVYLRIRTSGRLLNPREAVVITLLMILAFQSKEIAVTLPLAMTIYELLWHPWRPRSVREVLTWLRGAGCMIVIGHLAAAVFVIGKRFGSETLFNQPAYLPAVSAARYFENYGRYLGEFLYLREPIPSECVAMLLAAPVVVGALLKKRYLLWGGFSNVVSVLPLAFIPPRGGFAFYVPLLGWLVCAAGLIVLGRDLLVSVAPSRIRVPCRIVASVVTVVVVSATVLPLHSRMMQFPRPLLHVLQHENRTHWDQISPLLHDVPRGARILALDDPYPTDSYTLLFLLRLGYADRSLQVDRLKIARRDGADLDFGKYDYILGYAEEGFFLSTAAPSQSAGKDREDGG